MKHNLKLISIILAMFIITQFLGLYVMSYYGSENNQLPYGFESYEVEEQSEYNSYLYSIIFAFVIAISLLFLITKFNLDIIMRIWFFIVILIALALFINTLLPQGNYMHFIALIFALPLALSKIIDRNIIFHNITELMIYPGIAAIFVSLLNIYTIIALLILISIYDMWAVWHSGLMKKMVNYQIKKLHIFSGFFIPNIPKKTKLRLKAMKKKGIKNKKIKVNIALLGGGDIVFSMIAAGVMLRTFGLIPALITLLGAILGLSYILFFGDKKKAYPAMPYITSGIFLGMLVSYLVW